MSRGLLLGRSVLGSLVLALTACSGGHATIDAGQPQMDGGGMGMPDGGDGGAVSPDGGSATACVVDPLLIAAQPACHLDDQCPCGAHCVLGLCTASCITSADCGAGTYCDTFGYCRLTSDVGLIAVQPLIQPSIALTPTTLQLAPGDNAVHKVSLRLGAFADGGVVRLHPDPGLVLSCPNGPDAGLAIDAGTATTTVGDCMFLMTANPSFGVRLQTPTDGGAPQEVHVYAGSQIQTVTVQQTPPANFILGGAPAIGFYAGQAQLIQVLDQPAGGDGGITPLVFPISAVVNTAGGALALQIGDPGHALSPFDDWAGPITNAGGIYTLQLPTYRAVSDTLLPDTDAGAPDVEVLLVPAPAPLAVTGGDSPGLSFTLAFTAIGVTGDGGLPSASYAISLGVISDGGGPLPIIALDAGDVVTLDPTLGGKTSPWGNAFLQTYPQLPALGTLESDVVDPTILVIGEGLGVGDGGPLDSCGRADSATNVLQNTYVLAANELANLSAVDNPLAVGGVTSVSHLFGGPVAETTVQPAMAIPAGSYGLPPFPPDSGFNFLQSQSLMWQVEANALAQVYAPSEGAYPIATGTATVSATVASEVGSDSALMPCAFVSTPGGLQIAMSDNNCNAASNECVYADYLLGQSNNSSSTSALVSLTVADSGIDNCAALAALTGCTPLDVSSSNWLIGPTVTFGDAGSLPVATMTYTENLDTFGGPHGVGAPGPQSMTWSIQSTGSVNVYVTGVCSLNPPTDCVDRADCEAPYLGQTGDPIASDLSSTTRANTGDLVCQNGGFAADFALDENSGTGDAGAPALLSACQSELAELHEGLPPTVTSTDASALLTLLPPAQCVQGGRVLEGLELLDWYVTSGTPVPPRAQAEAVRLFQRWVKLHGFLAREEIEREPMAQVYAALSQINSGVVDPLGPTLSIQDDLNLSLSGWTLLLHPHFAQILASIPANILASPDYRTQIFPGTTFPTFDQGEGLPVAILETLDAQVELATAGVNQVWQATTPPDLTQLPGLEKVMRYVAALRPLAVQMEEQAAAAAGSGGLSWLPTYLQASASLDARLLSLSQALAQVRSGQGALGLPPGEVPLYFSGSTAGAGGEFSAISDYLLGGYPNDSTAWAPALVAQAQTDLSNAESAYAQQLNRQLETAVVQGNETALAVQYGDQLINLCGAVDDINGTPLAAQNILSSAPAFVNGSTCYQVQNTNCSTTPAQVLAAYTADDIAYQVCVVNQIQTVAGNVGASFADTGLNALAAAGGCDVDAGADSYQASGCAGGGACLSCSASGTQVTVAVTATSPVPILGAADTTAIDSNARGTCRTLFPNAVDPLPSPATINPNLANGNCYQGLLGQEALGLVSISDAVDIARSQYADQMDAYNIAMQSCLILDQGNMSIETLTSTFDNTMSGLRQSKLICDSIADAAGAVVSCASAASNVAGDADGSAETACGAAAVEAAAQIGSATLQTEMDNAQASHDAAVMLLQDNIAEQQCANNATQYIVGLHTQTLEIQQAINNFNIAQQQFNADQQSVQRILNEGRQQLAAYTSSATIDPSFDFWLSADIQQFSRDFALAQRATLLAVRAGEYEFQATLLDSGAATPGTTFESEVTSAKVPSQLSDVINGMLEITGTGGIQGNRPSQLSVILSMRDQLLQLADKSGQANTQHGLTPSQQFDELLAAPKYAVYDSNGVYQGQQIPFDLAPLGSSPFGVADTEGVSIFTGDSCAERIWGVFAAVEGADGGAVFVGDSSASFAQISLYKANTFYSQWCGPSPDGSAFQASNVDPGVDLFQDPTAGTPSQVTGFGTSSTEIQYTPARLEAFFNVSATELSQETYQNGQSDELATRGLYGNYALFIPAGQISLPSVAGPSAGLDLNAIDDILVRLDYVSVAN